MKRFLTTTLRILAKLTLARYRPRVVAITGSVGKTSTKAAVAAVLGSKFRVRASRGNYNNEIGVPLSIINEPSGENNPLVWLGIVIRALVKLIYANYPEILVLELGTDRPGDIAYLVNLLGKIEVGVLTEIGISHLEYFSTQAELAREKLTIIKKLDRTALAVLNFDSPKVYENRQQTKADIMGYGFHSEARVLISDFQIIRADDQWGANFKIHNQGHVVPFFLPNALGKPPVYAAAAACACAVRFGIDLATASETLKTFTPPAGRLRLISGLKQTVVIDDTYNSAPDSAIAALEALSQVATGRKVVAFGGMAELGHKTDSGHREVAAKLVENRIDLVFLVGENAKIIQDELAKRKFSGRVFWFVDSTQAAAQIAPQVLEHDTILVKGSQSARMERVVKAIMAQPQQASELLVRQDKKWLATP